MQSLLPAHLSDAEDRIPARLLADRPAHHGLPGDGVAAAAAGRHVHRQAADALFAAGRHGVLAGRAGRARLSRRHYAHAARRRGADRPRLGDLPSGILARRAARLGRPLRPGAIAVPGRRQFRPGDRAAARRLHRRAVRPDAASPGSRSAALVGIVVLWQVGGWYSAHLARAQPRARRSASLFAACRGAR